MININMKLMRFRLTSATSLDLNDVPKFNKDLYGILDSFSRFNQVVWQFLSV